MAVSRRWLLTAAAVFGAEAAMHPLPSNAQESPQAPVANHSPAAAALIDLLNDSSPLKLVGVQNDMGSTDEDEYSNFFFGKGIIDVAHAIGAKHIAFMEDASYQSALETYLKDQDIDAYINTYTAIYKDNRKQFMGPSDENTSEEKREEWERNFEENIESFQAFLRKNAKLALYAKSLGIEPHYVGSTTTQYKSTTAMFDFYNKKRAEFAEVSGYEHFWVMPTDTRDFKFDKFLKDNYRTEYYDLIDAEIKFADAIARANELTAGRLAKLDGRVLALVDNTFIGAGCSTTALLGEKTSVMVFPDNELREAHYREFTSPDLYMWNVRTLANPPDVELIFDTAQTRTPRSDLYTWRQNVMINRRIATCQS